MDNSKSIHILIDTKKEYQKKLNEILKKYFMKFIEKSYNDSLREFQTKLLKIPYWSDEKIEREYSKFLKFIRDKYDLSEDELSKILNIVIGLNIKIMTSIFDEIEIEMPKISIFWYKCLKRVCKYYYENPKIMKSDELFKNSKSYIDESIYHVLQKLIPLKHIINSKKEENNYYNFNNNLGNTSETTINKSNSSNKLKVTLESESHSNSNGLQYISSDEFENEYYKSEGEGNGPSKNIKEKSEEKHIKLPKYLFPNKKNYKNQKIVQSAKNEIDENFFDEI